MPIHQAIGNVIAGFLTQPGGGGRLPLSSGIQNFVPAGPVVGAEFETGAPIKITSGTNDACPPGHHLAQDSCTGQIVCKKNRRRRKRMLTCSDKADIAFITGTLGKGQMAQTAIASLIAKCG